MHTDEAVNASILGEILAGGSYHYDSRDRHGPALSALALPIARLCGTHSLAELDESELRLLPALVGAITILLFALLTPELGMGAAIAAALLWAFAPLPLYYSRYFIHETLFVSATLGFLVLGWRAMTSCSVVAGALAGLCAGLMLACKETSTLGYGGAAVAAGWWLIETRRARTNWTRAGMAGILAFVLVVGLLFSWGGLYWKGAYDLLNALPQALSRAGGQGHAKPPGYYLKLLGDGMSGWPLLILAIFGAGHCARQSGPKRVLVIYTLVTTTLYGAIPYKTPWLALNLWLPLSILAGCGFGVLFQTKLKGHRWGLTIATLGFAALIGHDSWERVFSHPSDERNPYAYAHTGEDLLRMPPRVAQLAGELGKSRTDLRIAVLATDPWPLPWYLRSFPITGYWQPDQEKGFAKPGSMDILITSPEAAESLGNQLKEWRPEYFGVRPGVLAILWTRTKSQQP